MHFYLLVYSKGSESENQLTTSDMCYFKNVFHKIYFTAPSTDSSNKQVQRASSLKLCSGRNLEIPGTVPGLSLIEHRNLTYNRKWVIFFMLEREGGVEIWL